MIRSCVLRYGRFVFLFAAAPTQLENKAEKSDVREKPWKTQAELTITRRENKRARKELERNMAMHVGFLVARELLSISANFPRFP